MCPYPFFEAAPPIATPGPPVKTGARVRHFRRCNNPRWHSSQCCGAKWARVRCELELELIQGHMAQKPVLRVEVGARVLRVRSVSREEAWASAGAQGAWVSWCGCEAD